MHNEDDVVGKHFFDIIFAPILIYSLSIHILFLFMNLNLGL